MKHKKINAVALMKIIIGMVIIPTSVIWYLSSSMPTKLFSCGAMGVGIAFYSIGILEIYDK